MALAVIQNPVHDSSFDARSRHHRRDDESITSDIVESRRESAYFRLIAPATMLRWPLSRPTRTERSEMSRCAEASTQIQRLFVEPCGPSQAAYIDATVNVSPVLGSSTWPAATTWLDGRHQIWRHIDAAWEVRGRRAASGFFIVEGDSSGDSHRLPEVWSEAFLNCLTDEALETSFPHRSMAEARAISRCFLGATTWQRVCDTFGLAWQGLSDRLPNEIVPLELPDGVRP